MTDVDITRPVVRIDQERLWANLIQLKEIGGSDDTSTGLRGVRRLSMTLRWHPPRPTSSRLRPC